MVQVEKEQVPGLFGLVGSQSGGEGGQKVWIFSLLHCRIS
jgi:hypothetical protein